MDLLMIYYWFTNDLMILIRCEFVDDPPPHTPSCEFVDDPPPPFKDLLKIYYMFIKDFNNDLQMIY